MKNRYLCCLSFALMVCLSGLSQIVDPEPNLWLNKRSFTIGYNCEKLCPNVVIWDITKNDAYAKRKRMATSFRQDPDVPSPRAKRGDYTKSGYMRGHLCPSADRKVSSTLMKETFLLSNVCPQTEQLNCFAWLEIENRSRAIAAATGRAQVGAGTLFSSDTVRYLGRSKIQVPEALWKVVVSFSPDTVVTCFICQNDSVIRSARSCIVPLDSVRKIVNNSLLFRLTLPVSQKETHTIFLR